MKKLGLFFTVSLFTLSLTVVSCSKNSCYECTNNVGGTTVEVDICDGKFTTTSDGNSVTTDLPNSQSESDYADALESGGYTCNKK